MYIWRGRNSRDRRDFQTSSFWKWGAYKGATTKNDGDCQLRYDGEMKHVNYFGTKTYMLMYNYLNTENGIKELDAMIHHLESRERLDVIELKEDSNGGHHHDSEKKNAESNMNNAGITAAKHGESPTRDHTDPKPNPKDDKKNVRIAPEVLKRKNIHEVFRKFDADGSGAIDIDELRVLLKELNVPMKDEEIEDLMSELDADGGGGIEFEEFYTWFVNEADKQRKKNRLEYFKSAARGGVFNGFKRLILEVEARNLLIDVAVHRAKHGAVTEYRLAHPADFYCDVCGACFPSLGGLQEHKTGAAELHAKWEEEKREIEEKGRHVDHIFTSEHGRKFAASRLMFSTELLPAEERIKVTTLDPFRPNKYDPGGQRFLQQLKGMLVQGSDPKAGIRPVPRKFGFSRQHVSKQAMGQTSLNNVLVGLVHCRDDAIDIVTAPATSTHAPVRFMWHGESTSKVSLVGEFNCWKPQELDQTDRTYGRVCRVVNLAPGRYRYRFLIGGKQVIDEQSSVIEDPPPRGRCNIILVINPASDRKGDDGEIIKSSQALYPVSSAEAQSSGELMGLKHINLRNIRLYDDGAWAFASFMQRNSIIESIDLSHNGLSDEGMMAIGSCVDNRLSRLHTLKLNGNGFGVDGAKYLLRAFNDSNTIAHLELSANRLGDDGCDVMCELIKHHSNLRHIYLDNNYIGNDGASSLGLALEKNRTLLTLSLRSNRIYAYGAERLGYYLQWNATLTDLRVSNNPLGPDGTRNICTLLLVTNSLKSLELASVGLVRDNLATGMLSIGYGLRKCRSLTYLDISNNNISDDFTEELGQSLSYNKTLLHLKVDNNPISAKWFRPNHYFICKVSNEMPSLRTSLDKNIEAQSDPKLAKKYAVKNLKPITHDEFEGTWTHKREWQEVNRKLELRKMLAAQSAGEEARIATEEEYVSEHLTRYMTILKKFLDTKQARKHVRIIAKLISSHLEGLSLVIPDLPPPTMPPHLLPPPELLGPPPKSEEEAEEEERANKRKSNIERARLLLEADERRDKLRVWSRDNAEAIRAAEEAVVEEKRKYDAIVHAVPKDEDFHFTNNTIVVAFFKLCGADERYYLLDPPKLEHLCQMMGLPLPKDEVQSAVEQTLVPKVFQIGFRKFANYLVQNANKLSLANKFNRKRLLYDMRLRPPVEEAKTVIMQYEQRRMSHTIIEDFRSQPGKKPMYLCHFCNIRFSSAKKFEKHREKNGGSDHKRLLQDQLIAKDQHSFLNKAKVQMMGCSFPAFFELVDDKNMPPMYFPQIFDNMGFEGRPIGVIEANCTVRVQDVLGDFVQVAYEGRLGWALWRIGWHGTVVMRQACLRVPFFSWDGLRVRPWSSYAYYKVSDQIPEKTELKVRLMPLLTSEAVGSLQQNQVVEVGAIFGDWIQIRFEHHPIAWALRIAGGGVLSEVKSQLPKSIALLQELSPGVSRRMAKIITRSPYFVTPKDLVVDAVEEALWEEKLRLAELAAAADDDMDREDYI